MGEGPPGEQIQVLRVSQEPVDSALPRSGNESVGVLDAVVLDENVLDIPLRQRVQADYGDRTVRRDLSQPLLVICG